MAKWVAFKFESSTEVHSLYPRTHCHSMLRRPACGWVQTRVRQINWVFYHDGMSAATWTGSCQKVLVAGSRGGIPEDKYILVMFVLPLSEDLLMTSGGDNILEKALNPPRTAVLPFPSLPFFPLQSALGIVTFVVCLYRWDHFCLWWWEERTVTLSARVGAPVQPDPLCSGKEGFIYL